MDGERVEAENAEEWVPSGLERRPLAPPPAEEDWRLAAARANGAGPSRSRVSRGAARARGAIDLNTVPFEALRASGFSVTQANRLLAQRERMGGFRSLGDVDGLTGFPRELKDWLQAHGTV